MTTVGMALIVRDEADKIERCLESFWAHVDQVVVVDTGSTDGTVQMVEDFAHHQRVKNRPAADKLTLATFDWCDDFAAARNHADSLLTTDWTCWIDADDVLHGAENLRAIVATTPPTVAALGAGYDYAQDPNTGACCCYLRRERLVRRGKGHWTGAVHEAQLVDGPIQWLPAGTLEWRHAKPIDQMGSSSERNLKILKRWARQEPHNTRVLAYMGTEHAGRGDFRRAAIWFRRYLREPAQWPDERAQVRRKLAGCLIALGDRDAAAKQAWEAVAENPSWPDSALTLAEVFYERREWPLAAHWARQVLAAGQPDTLLIVNPLDYLVQPHVILCGALGEQGHHQQAIEHGDKALQHVQHPDVARAVAQWRRRVRDDQTAGQVIALAQNLVGHDEQAKALRVLEDCVPWYADQHPEVVQARSQLRERLLFTTAPAAYEKHYREDGSKPEDFRSDEESAQIAAVLPRVAFLLDGIREQVAA